MDNEHHCTIAMVGEHSLVVVTALASRIQHGETLQECMFGPSGFQACSDGFLARRMEAHACVQHASGWPFSGALDLPLGPF